MHIHAYTCIYMYRHVYTCICMSYRWWWIGAFFTTCFWSKSEMQITNVEAKSRIIGKSAVIIFSAPIYLRISIFQAFLYNYSMKRHILKKISCFSLLFAKYDNIQACVLKEGFAYEFHLFRDALNMECVVKICDLPYFQI